MHFGQLHAGHAGYAGQAGHVGTVTSLGVAQVTDVDAHVGEAGHMGSGSAGSSHTYGFRWAQSALYHLASSLFIARHAVLVHAEGCPENIQLGQNWS